MKNFIFYAVINKKSYQQIIKCHCQPIRNGNAKNRRYFQNGNTFPFWKAAKPFKLKNLPKLNTDFG